MGKEGKTDDMPASERDETASKLTESLAELRALKDRELSAIPEAVAAITTILRKFKEALAPEIGTLLEQFAGLRFDTFEERKLIVTQISLLLEESGMSIRCPKTGHLGKLEPTNGFAIVKRGRSGGYLSSSMPFPKLELAPTEHEPRIHNKVRNITSRKDSGPDEDSGPAL